MRVRRRCRVESSVLCGSPIRLGRRSVWFGVDLAVTDGHEQLGHRGRDRMTGQDLGVQELPLRVHFEEVGPSLVVELQVDGAEKETESSHQLCKFIDRGSGQLIYP